MADPPSLPVSADRVRNHLAKVLSSQAFSRADRQKRFLAFAVENSLTGNRERLKESVIGHEVFDRPANYDPKIDAIVRVEANRLRKKLEKYYQTEGSSEPLRFAMPAGAYLIRTEHAPVDVDKVQPRKVSLLWPSFTILTIFMAITVWAVAFRAPTERALAISPVRVTSFGGVSVDPILSPDGGTLVFASDLDGGGTLALWSQQTAGRMPVRLTPPVADAIEPDISPDGSTIAFHYRHPNFPGIYTVPITGGEPAQFALLGSVPRYSPDGKFLLFTTHNSKRVDFGRIFYVKTTGGVPNQLAHEFADAHGAIWSPDGRFVLFCGTQISGVKEKEHDWWILPFPPRQGVDTASKTGLLPEFAQRYTGSPLAVPPNSEIERPGEWYDGRIFFSSVTGGPPSLWSAEVSARKAGSVSRLTAGTRRHAAPRVRNNKIVFTGGDSDIGVWRIPFEKSGRPAEPVRITSEAPSEIYPALSPNGKLLAYVSDNFLDRSQPRQVRLRELSTGKEHIVRPSGNSQGGLAFAPDGVSLAFSEFGKPEIAIFVAPVAGGKPKKICDDCGRVVDWSPDGGSILYEAGANVAFLGVLDIASGNARKLVAHSEHPVRSGRFSPDGKWVIFYAETGRESSRVFVAPARELSPPSQWVPVTDGNGLDAGPAFAPDGRSVFYASFNAGNGTIFKRPLDARIGRPTGPAIVVHAFRSPRRGFTRITPWHIGMAVHREQGIVLSLEEQSSEIYIADLPSGWIK